MVIPMLYIVRFSLVVASLAATLLVVPAHAAPPPHASLTKCPFKDQTSEIQFYNTEIEIWNLPETCTEDDMVTIGVLIQSVVDEVEDRMPQYEGEKSITFICPYPEKVDAGRRRLQTTTTTTATKRRRRSGTRYKYSGTGRACRRCRNKTTARRRRRLAAMLKEEDENFCAIAERAHYDAEYSASICQNVLQSMKNKVNESGSAGSGFILQQAEQDARDCQDQSRVAIEDAMSALTLCDKASQIRALTDKDQVKKVTNVAVAASLRAKNALAQIRQASFDLTTLLCMESVQGRGNLQGRMLAQLGLCDYRDEADTEVTRGKGLCDKIDHVLDNMNKVAKSIGTQDVQEIMKRANSKKFDSKCRDQVERTEEYKNELADICKEGKENDLRKAAKLYDEALDSTTKAEEELIDLQEYQGQLDELSGAALAAAETPAPTPFPTVSPTPFPTVSPTPFPTVSPTPFPTESTTQVVVPDTTSVPPAETTPMVSTAGILEPETTQVLPITEEMSIAAATEALETEMSTPAIPSEISPIQQEYLNLLSRNLELADTSCEKVKKVMIQKTIAEETILESYKAYDEIMEMARGYEGNANVERIKDKALKAHLRVEVEAGKARVAADLASELCSQQEQTRFRGRRLMEEIVQEEVDVATTAALGSRLALSEERSALDEMEEAIALIEYDPNLDGLEAAVKKDKKILVKHLDAVEHEIDHVDDQLKELPDTAPETSALATKKDLLVEEEHQIEEVLTNQDHFLISESALKKDEYYTAVAPDYEEFPPLQYVVQATRNGKDLTVETNWDRGSERSDPKKSWYGRFGDNIVEDLVAWLPVAYNDAKGGCITQDTEIAVDVVITELKTIWEKLNQQQCSSNEEEAEQPEPASCSTAGPSPVGGKAIWSSAARENAATPYYQDFDGIEGKFKGSAMQGADGAARYYFAYGASSPVCNDQIFVGVGTTRQMGGTRFDGSDWSTISMDTTGGIPGSATDVRWRGIVGAYESLSGRAMVVFNTGSADSYLRFSLLDPETNEWSDSTDVDPFYVGSEPKTLDIASDPKSNSIVLAFSDTGRKIYVTVWNGVEWTAAVDISDTQYYAAFSVAFEAESGRAMVVYGQRLEQSNLYYRIYDGTTWSDEQVAFNIGAPAPTYWVQLRSDPFSNRLVVGIVVQNRCVHLAIWNGNDAFEALDEATCAVADVSYPTVSVAFESESGDALAVFSESGSNTVSYKTLESGSTTWSSKMSTTAVESSPRTVELFPNPDPKSNQVMLMVKDRGLGLFAAPWDGSTFDSFTQLESNMGSGVKGPFWFLWNPVVE